MPFSVIVASTIASRIHRDDVEQARAVANVEQRVRRVALERLVDFRVVHTERDTVALSSDLEIAHQAQVVQHSSSGTKTWRIAPSLMRAVAVLMRRGRKPGWANWCSEAARRSHPARSRECRRAAIARRDAPVTGALGNKPMRAVSDSR